MNEVLDFSLKSIWMERWETIRTLSLWLRLAGYVMERFFTLNGMVEGTKTRFHLFYSCVWNEHKLTSQWEFCLSKRQLHFTKNCCRLDVCVPHTFICWNLIPNVMPFGGGVFGRWLGPGPRGLPFPFCHVRTQQENVHLWTRNQALTKHWIC